MESTSASDVETEGTHSIIPCEWNPSTYHLWPSDWIFGGANGLDPRADPRYKTSAYEYYDDKLDIIWRTSVPVCDDHALDYFTFVADRGPSFNPVWVVAIRHNRVPQKLQWTYDKATDTITPIQKAA